MERNINSNCFISSQKIISKGLPLAMKEFIINKFLKLRLEEGKTVIYVNNEKFIQCKYLLLHIPIEEMTSLEDIKSIDEVAEKLDRSLERGDKNRSQISIPPEVEFWGHCSNLQVWYENNYNTKLIHSNLAFPLLKELMEAGDRFAEKIFKEEIAIRFSEGNKTVRKYLRRERYLEYLDRDELYSLSHSIEFNSFGELIRIIRLIIDKLSSVEFLGFLDFLDNTKMKRFILNSKESSRMNFYQAIIEYLGDYNKRHSENEIIKKIFNKVGMESFDSLLEFTVGSDGYINLPVLEVLIYIDNERMKDFLWNTDYKFRFGFKPDLWDFQYILNVLLRCFDPEEIMLYLEKKHKYDLNKNIKPKLYGYNYLKISDQNNVSMKQFITAFLLEEAGDQDFRENLKTLGSHLIDAFLYELIDRNNEVNEKVVKFLAWVGGEARVRLLARLNELFDNLTVKKYKKKYRKYLIS